MEIPVLAFRQFPQPTLKMTLGKPRISKFSLLTAQFL